MFGCVEWGSASQDRGVRLAQRRILNLPFCCVSIPQSAKTPEWLLRLRCAQAAGKLQKKGICRAVFPEFFPFLDVFARRNIVPIDPVPLYRILAADLTETTVREQNLSTASAVIAVCADHLTSQVRQTVTQLCARCRYVTLSCGDGGEPLRRKLRREYGAVLVLSNDPQQLARADVLVRFSPRQDVPEGKNEVRLYAREALPSVTLRLREQVGKMEIPDAVSRDQLFSALSMAGVLRAEDVEITGKARGA